MHTATAQTGTDFSFRRDAVLGADIAALFAEHEAAMVATAPPESRHALDLDGLRAPGIHFWSLHADGVLAGCGALKALGDGHGEIKAMRTARICLRRGIGTRMLAHLVEQARQFGYHRLSLETGSMDYFAPARRLYTAQGFEPCAAFGNYREDPNSVFLTRRL